MTKILVIDADVNDCSRLQELFRSEGYDVISASDGARGLELARTSQPSLVVLEIDLPILNGFAVCRRLRFEDDVPILILSARQTEAERVIGLDLGADDYIGKPFSTYEFLARIRALLRRSTRSLLTTRRDELQAGQLLDNRTTRQALHGQTLLNLSPKEFDLLVCLMQSGGAVLSREAILRYVWGDKAKIGVRTVDVHIRWLRMKIEPDPDHPYYIQTVRSIGYRFAPEGQG